MRSRIKFGETVVVSGIDSETFRYMKDMGDGTSEVFGPWDFTELVTPTYGANTVGRVRNENVYRV